MRITAIEEGLLRKCGSVEWMDFLSSSVAAFLLVTAAATQQPAQRPSFSSGTDLVILSATAVDRRGRPVTDLRRDEVRVFEDGRPQKLEHFSQGREASARLLLLLDASGSMTGELKTASTRMAALQILAALDPEDEAALAAFDHKYWGVVPFTRDRGKVEQAMAEIEPFGATALHDALARASSDLASHGEGRRAVVVLTDGIDTASQLVADEVLSRSQALDVPIYAVSVVSPLDDPKSDRFSGLERPALATAGASVLARYAELSGGAAFTVSEIGGLRAAASRIVSELKQQYRLGYDPPPGPPRFRRIDVRTTRKGVLLRTRGGYVPRT
jgi:Ca-activated chloride channel family protein